MSGGSSANNSWTILTPEESVAETLRPLAEGTEHNGESLTSAAENPPAKGAEYTEGLPVEGHTVSEEKTAELSGETSTEQDASMPATAADASAPTSLDVSAIVPDSDELSLSKGPPQDPAQSSPDPDSFSDSYTHITPSSDEPLASPLSTETLGGVEVTQEEEGLGQEDVLHPCNGEEPHQEEEEESDLSPRVTDVGKQADSTGDSEVAEETTEKTGKDGEPEPEPEVRRRRSLLAALERIGRAEEEEDREEEFQLPQREEDSGFSVNKCILGAVILLGLGTIFFSESDYVSRELKDAELPGKQEWLNSEAPPPPVDADNTELLNKLAKGHQQISVLQAQLQAQKEQLNVAKGQAAEGAKERLRWEELEKENSRLKKEMASLPVLLKENERMKRELESVPALQKELETLRATVTELKLSTAEALVKPSSASSSGQTEDSTDGTAGSTEGKTGKPWEKKKDIKREKRDEGEIKEGKAREKSEWKEGGKWERKDGGKAEKKGKHEQGTFEKEKNKEEKKWHSEETKYMKEKDRKKEKASRGDEGKQWKDREGKKEWVEKSERKDWKQEKEWKKGKHEKVNEGKVWRGKEERKDSKAGKEHGEKHKGREEWKGEKEWKKRKDGYKESGKVKWERTDWKEKGEKKEWKKESERKSKNGKDHSKEGRWKGERKQWEESKSHGKERKDDKNRNGDKEWKRKDERKQWREKEEQWNRGGQKERKHNGEWNKDESRPHKRKDELSGHHKHEEEHVWGDRKPPHSHRRPSPEQPEYWSQQRDRLQHKPKPHHHCNSLDSCAQAQGLLPVPLPEFEAILQTYLAKAEEAGVDASKSQELKKLITEFFKDGLFVHDQMSFQDFVEDVGDVLEDMVEGDEEEEEDGEEEEDSAIEEEMEGFEREVMKRFLVPGASEKEEKSKGEWRKESGRGRG